MAPDCAQDFTRIKFDGGHMRFSFHLAQSESQSVYSSVDGRLLSPLPPAAVIAELYVGGEMDKNRGGTTIREQLERVQH
jgi:hypothetical protein